MKCPLILLLPLLLISNICAAQWTEWSNLNHGLEVSFKFGKTENSYSYIRFKNISSAIFCDGRVEFDVFRNGKTDRIGFNSGKIKPQEIIESPGAWFNCAGSINNLKLTKLYNSACKDILRSANNNNGVSEISFDKKQPSEQELKRQPYIPVKSDNNSSKNKNTQIQSNNTTLSTINATIDAVGNSLINDMQKRHEAEQKRLADEIDEEQRASDDRVKTLRIIKIESLSSDQTNRDPNDGYFALTKYKDIGRFMSSQEGLDETKTNCTAYGILHLVSKPYNDAGSYVDLITDFSKVDPSSFEIHISKCCMYLHFTGQPGLYQIITHKYNSSSQTWVETDAPLNTDHEGNIKLDKNLLQYNKQYLLKDFAERLKSLIKGEKIDQNILNSTNTSQKENLTSYPEEAPKYIIKDGHTLSPDGYLDKVIYHGDKYLLLLISFKSKQIYYALINHKEGVHTTTMLPLDAQRRMNVEINLIFNDSGQPVTDAMAIDFKQNEVVTGSKGLIERQFPKTVLSINEFGEISVH